MKNPLIFLLVAALTAASITCSQMDVRMGMADGDGVRLSYRIVGEGAALVVLHDGPGYEKSLMYPGFDQLDSDFRVIYYDQRGCGRSEPLTALTPVTVQDNVEDLEALRRYLHLENLSIAAHGWGAAIALEYAREYSRYVDSIILIAPISPFLPEPDLESVIARLSPEIRDRILDLYGYPSISIFEKRERVMKLILPSLFYQEQALAYVDLATVRFAADVNIRGGAELKTLDLFPVLGEISVPTLVVVGRHDITTPVRDQMAYADGISTSSAIVFNNSGHFPFLEERSLFTNIAREFLLHGSLPALVRADP